MKKLWRLRTSHNFGKIGEILAIIFLLFKGYKIIAHNHRNYFGEIDIIAKKGKNLVFLEVKSRKKIFDVRQVVSFWQQKRIVNAGDYFWLKNKKYQNCNVRFDLIVISRALKIKHYQNFF